MWSREHIRIIRVPCWKHKFWVPTSSPVICLRSPRKLCIFSRTADNSCAHRCLRCNGLAFVAEKAMAPHSSTLAWKILWMEEPGGLQSMGSLRVRHDWATSLYFSLSCTGEGNGNPLQYSCLENPMDGGAWWAAAHGVVKSRTRLSDFTFT